MAESKKNFEETLYRLVESEGSAPSASEFKSRMDRDAQFRAAFDYTRNTVASLQGLRAKPAPPQKATFSQRDLDRLTLDIFKGYKGKLAEVLYQLGEAYLLESPPEGVGIAPTLPVVPAEQSEARLQKVARSMRAVAGESQKSVEEASALSEKIADVETAPPPSGRALASLQLSRSLRPRHSMTWAREGLVWLSRNDPQRAWQFSQTAAELAKDQQTQRRAFELQQLILFAENNWGKASDLSASYLERDPYGWHARFNFGTTRLNLGDTQGGERELQALLLHAPSNGEAREVCLAGLNSTHPFYWELLKRDPASFDRCVKNIELYLGKDAISLNRGKP